MTASALFDELAPGYGEHFAAGHRAAYDDLAWEHVVPLLPAEGGLVVDAGCGIGRWADRFVAHGHRVIGIDASARMVEASRRRAAEIGGDRFSVVHADMTAAEPDVGAGADVVVAMGSLQYVADPSVALRRFREWLRPGGAIAVLVDSLVALVLELGAIGRWDEALARSETGRGTWAPSEARGRCADVRLFDRASLEALATDAGFERVRTCGLLVSFSAIGRDAFDAARTRDPHALYALERRLARVPALADAGKQLLLTASRPRCTP